LSIYSCKDALFIDSFYEWSINKILVTTDGSDNAKRAVQGAAELAKNFGSELLILSVVSMNVTRIYSPIAPYPSDEEYSAVLRRSESDANKIVDEAVALAKMASANVTGKVVTTMESVPETILKTAESEKADLIVVGTRGLGGFRKLILGSVSSAVVSHAQCAVLVVR
jgi:nucleotide-binding universal stress UspA family protein